VLSFDVECISGDGDFSGGGESSVTWGGWSFRWMGLPERVFPVIDWVFSCFIRQNAQGSRAGWEGFRGRDCARDAERGNADWA
jgi:hypothetical protein